MPAFCTRTPLPSCAPQLQPKVQLHTGLSLSFWGKPWGSGCPKDTLGAPCLSHLPSHLKDSQIAETPSVSLPRRPESHRDEGLCSDTPRCSQPLAVPPWYPKSSLP